MILNFLNDIIVIVGEGMEEKEITFDGIKNKIIVNLDDEYIESLNEDEIKELDKTIELDTVIKDI